MKTILPRIALVLLKLGFIGWAEVALPALLTFFNRFWRAKQVWLLNGNFISIPATGDASNSPVSVAMIPAAAVIPLMGKFTSFLPQRNNLINSLYNKYYQAEWRIISSLSHDSFTLLYQIIRRPACQALHVCSSDYFQAQAKKRVNYSIAANSGMCIHVKF